MRGEGRVGARGISWNVSGPGAYGGQRGEGDGAIGVASAGGYGGVFQGGKAHLRLLPGAAAGKPTTGAHVKGELYLDASAALYLCVTAGTPGTWKKVALV